MNTESCDCRRVNELNDGDFGTRGDFFFRGDYLHLVLPDGTHICIAVTKDGARPANVPASRPCWKWDGNEEKPTLTPSIHTIDHWHGHLTAGRLVSC
jgi:hypothetical protein